MSLNQDTMLIVVLLFVGVIAVVPILYVMDVFNDAIQGSDVNEQAKTNIAGTNNSLPRVFDWMFALFAFGLPLTSMGLAYFNRVPSVFFYLSIGLVLFIVLIAGSLQDGYTDFAASDGIRGIISELPITDWIMSNFLAYSIFCFFMIAWGTYLKLGRQSVGGVY